MLKKILFFVYLLFITSLSLMPSSNFPKLLLFPYADKLAHFCMYAGFAFLFFLAWGKYFNGKRQIVPFLIIVAYGLLMEVLQRYSSFGRSFDLTDELANSLGFFPGWLAWKFFSSFIKRRKSIKNAED